MDSLQLDEIVQRIEHSFGEELPVTAEALGERDSETLERVFAGAAYQSYMQDQVNRHIIRDYLINAVILGFIDDESFAKLSRQAVTSEGRSSLSIHMLMYSVEAANDIPLDADKDGLKALRPVPGSPPHMVIVSS